MFYTKCTVLSVTIDMYYGEGGLGGGGWGGERETRCGRDLISAFTVGLFSHFTEEHNQTTELLRAGFYKKFHAEINITVIKYSHFSHTTGSWPLYSESTLALTFLSCKRHIVVMISRFQLRTMIILMVLGDFFVKGQFHYIFHLHCRFLSDVRILVRWEGLLW